jgi:hypothetical protein
MEHIMCLTLDNAAAVFDHREPLPGRGYTRTRHPIGHLTPGDPWRPDPNQPPRTITATRRRHGRITLTDQTGVSYPYSAAALIPTAVPDPLRLTDSSQLDVA